MMWCRLNEPSVGIAGYDPHYDCAFDHAHIIIEKIQSLIITLELLRFYTKHDGATIACLSTIIVKQLPL